MIRVLLILSFLFSMNSFAQGKKNVRYEYKKFERFDFDALDVEGTNSSPGDLSIGPRFKQKFKNKIPLKRNFNREMKKSVDSIL